MGSAMLRCESPVASSWRSAFSGAGAWADETPAIALAELIFEHAPFASCHASTIAETPSGELVAAWFGGTEEGQPDVSIWTARRSAEGWTAPVEVADCAEHGVDYACWNPVLHQAGNGPLLLFYKSGPSPSEWWGMLLRSQDEGRTWSAPERLPTGILGPIRAKPLELPDGTLLAGSSTEHDGWRLHFERTRDLGRTWESSGPIHDGRTVAAIQPAFLTHPGGGSRRWRGVASTASSRPGRKTVAAPGAPREQPGCPTHPPVSTR